MSVGDKIRFQRKALGLTQTELGERLGVKTNAVSKWECGRVEDIPTSKIKAMATLFGVQPSYLIDDSITKVPTPVSESGQPVNIVKIAGRDGSFIEKQLNDKELQALKSFVDLLPDASDDL